MPSAPSPSVLGMQVSLCACSGAGPRAGSWYPEAAGTLAGTPAFSLMDTSKRMQRCPKLRRMPSPIASGPCVSCRNTLAASPLLGPVMSMLAGDPGRASLRPIRQVLPAQYVLQGYFLGVLSET
ncbi:inosine triphosphatase [Phyllostomus discolor]|uniref:Inosine triphosphatase n=1 Tax=Phyllostomus discolor TaxID=89673 RepID=A0A833Z127_9CHIR|nr:inosine triphosphatase [Phyllostomus discolor]